MTSPPRSLVVALALAAALCPARPAAAFDYLEHSYLSDRACLEAQRRLAPALDTSGGPAVARYLALGLMCPERWTRPYCDGGYKQLEGSLNRLEAPPAESGDHSVTLGDYTALPDHLVEFGPVRGFPLASKPGLTERTWTWLSWRAGDAGGVVSDVAEDACEYAVPVPWKRFEDELVSALEANERGGGLPDLPRQLLSPGARLELPRGPHDPAGAYSFDNPQYLDLVRRNTQHFGADAYTTWLGFHSAAQTLASTRCDELLGLNPSALEDLAAGLPAFEAIDWDALDDAGVRKAGCGVLRERLRARLLEWSGRAAPELVAPVRVSLAALADPKSPDTEALLDAVAAALTGAVFEGSGLHFLQDSLSGGHLRVRPSAHDLALSRHAHDADSRSGVVTSFGTRGGAATLVAFGDGYLLSAPEGGPARCDWSELGADRAAVASCLVREQRALLLAATTASLLDWALGGLLYASAPARELPSSGCPEGESAERFVCRYLPTRAPTVDGEWSAPAPATLAHGSLPVPPPSFSYESLLFASALDARGDRAQLGVRLVFLSELGSRANWLSSYHFGLLAAPGVGESAHTQLEFSYMFHWRWAARFLLNAGPFVYGGLHGFGDRPAGFAGVGPSFGVSALPEGWIQLPLELSFAYRLPMRLLDGHEGLSRRAIRLEAHWLEIAVGLAFM